MSVTAIVEYLMTTRTTTNEAIQQKTISDGTTSAATHLARLDELERCLTTTAEASDWDTHKSSRHAAQIKRHWAESVRWAIKREIARATQDAANSPTGDSDERATAGIQWLQENRQLSREAMDRPAIAREKPPTWKAATEKAFVELAMLKENWDSYGGRPIDPAHIRAARFVLDQIMEHDTMPPHVTPMSNGSVQLEWCARGIDLEIEICEITVSEGNQIRFCHILYLSPRDAVDERDEWEGVRSLDEVNCLCGTIRELSG